MKYTEQQKQFIKRAREIISDNPYDRLGPKTKQIIDTNNFVFDAHCHIFDGACVSVTYLVTRFLLSFAEFLPPRIYWIVKKIFRRIFGIRTFETDLEEQLSVKAFIEKLVEGSNAFLEASDAEIQAETDQPIEEFINEINSVLDNDELTADSLDRETFLDEFETYFKELDRQLNLEEITFAEAETVAFLSFDRKGFFKRLWRIISILRSTKMQAVLTQFENKYAIRHVYNKLFNANKDQLSIVLGMDLNSGWEETSEKDYIQQNNELGGLSKTRAILPYLPVDPRRADDKGEGNLYEVFLRAFNRDNPSYFGVKCYPALGYLPTDQRLDPIFKICAEKNIPVLTHCGGEMISTFVNPVVAYRGTQKVEFKDQLRKDRARKLNEPIEWEPVLAKHINLRLCLGHFGGKGAWNGESATKDRIKTILNMMATYPNLYADFSFNLESQVTVNKFKTKLFANNSEGKIMRERSMFGTDFWVVLPISDLNKDQKNFLKEMEDFCDQLVTENVVKYLNL